MIELGRKCGDADVLCLGYEWQIGPLMELGNLAQVDSNIETIARPAKGRRQWHEHTWWILMRKAGRATLEGRFAKAEQFSLEAMAAGKRAGERAAIEWFGILLFQLRWDQGRLQELEEGTRRAAQRYWNNPGYRTGLAFLYSELGRCEAARGEFERFAANDFNDIARDGAWLLRRANLAMTCVFLDDQPRAARLYESMLPFATLHIQNGGFIYLGSVSHYLGLLANTLHEWDAAGRHFAAAFEMHTRMRARPFAARTRYEYAKMLLARGEPADRENARDLLDHALDTAREIGMKGVEEKAAALKLEAYGESSG